MQAIVSAIDPPQRQAIEDIWGELRAVFGLRGEAETRPHFTYQAAEQYDRGVDATLGGLAASSPPFAVETHGIGIFRGDETVVYLHVDLGEALRAMHQRIWQGTSAMAKDVKQVYAIETWVPHITLAIGDLAEEMLPDIVALLGRREYRWTIPVTNLCLIPDTNALTEWLRFELGGGGPPPTL